MDQRERDDSRGFGFFASNLGMVGFPSVESGSYRTVQELLENAIDAIKSRPEPLQGQPAVVVRIEPRGEHFAHLEVQDLGPGIAAEDVSRLCGTVFCSSKRSGAGAGAHKETSALIGGEASKRSAEAPPGSLHGGTHGIGIKMTLLNAAVRAPDVLRGIVHSRREGYEPGAEAATSAKLETAAAPARQCGTIDIISTTSTMTSIAKTQLGLQRAQETGMGRPAISASSASDLLANAKASITVLGQAHMPKPAGLACGTSIRMVVPGTADKMLEFAQTYFSACSLAGTLPGECVVRLPSASAPTGAAYAISEPAIVSWNVDSRDNINNKAFASGYGVASVSKASTRVSVSSYCLCRPRKQAVSGSSTKEDTSKLTLAAANALAADGLLSLRRVTVLRVANGVPMLLGPCGDCAMRYGIFGVADDTPTAGSDKSFKGLLTHPALSTDTGLRSMTGELAAPTQRRGRKRKAPEEAQSVNWGAMGLRVVPSNPQRPFQAPPMVQAGQDRAKDIISAVLHAPHDGVLQAAATSICERTVGKQAKTGTLSRRAERAAAGAAAAAALNYPTHAASGAGVSATTPIAASVRLEADLVLVVHVYPEGQEELLAGALGHGEARAGPSAKLVGTASSTSSGYELNLSQPPTPDTTAQAGPQGMTPTDPPGLVAAPSIPPVYAHGQEAKPSGSTQSNCAEKGLSTGGPFLGEAIKYGNLAKTFLPPSPALVAAVAKAGYAALADLKSKVPDLFLEDAEVSDRAVLAQHLPTIARSFASILKGAPEMLQAGISERLRVSTTEETAEELHSLLVGQCLRSRASLREADKRTRKRSRY